MSFRIPIYYGITRLGRESFGNNNNTYSSQDYVQQKKKQTFFLLNNRVINNRSKNYEEFYIKKVPYINATTQKYKNLKDNKNNLSSGLNTKLDLNNLNIISNSTSGIAPTTLSATDNAFMSYNIDPSGSILGNNICRLNNFNNYKVLTLRK